MTLVRYIALFMLLAVAGCSGYSLGEGNSSVLAPEYRTIAIGEVTNPTTLSWLEPRIRRLLRDELNNRGTITWVNQQSQADAIITIIIKSYNRPTAVEGASDQTLRSDANFQFSARITSAMDDSILWNSGMITESWPFFSGGEEEADMEVTRLGIRRLADRMTQNY